MAGNRFYNPDDLNKIHGVLLDVLKELIRICDKHGFNLFMEGGTAIGTLRHQGFIPWDDDIDVFLLREEYDRLLKILPEELGEDFGTDNWCDNKDFPAPNACVYAKNTVMMSAPMKYCKYKYGISIGIYPYDNIPDDDNLAKKQLKKCWFLGRINWLKVLPFPYIPHKGFKRFVIYAICGAIHILLKPFPRKWFVNRYEKVSRAYNNTETKRSTIACSTPIFRTNIEKDKLFPPAVFQFEGVDVKLPACYDELLTREYGDYMKLPPEDKRKNHYPLVLKFADDKISEEI